MQTEPPFVFFFLVWRVDKSTAWIASNLWSRHSPNFWTSQSCFLLSNCFFFFRVRACIYGKLMVTTKLIVPNAWLLGLIGTCPTRILFHSRSLPWVCPNQGSKKALPAGYNFSGNGNTAVFFNTSSKIWQHPPHPWPLHWASNQTHDQEQQPDLTFSFGVLWLVSSINPPWSIPVLWLWDRPPFSSE